MTAAPLPGRIGAERSAMRKLVLATTNPGKVRELRRILEGLPAEVLSLADFPGIEPAEETGTTFAENAVLKAEAVAKATGLIALADDSGLEIDALDGAPGVYSSRFGGPDAEDVDRNQLVLDLLREIPDCERGARYRAVIAIATPTGETVLAEGACEGRIAREPHGAGGFGYDPIFLLPDRGETMADLAAADPDLKNRISHRGRALEAARHLLERLVGEEAANGS